MASSHSCPGAILPNVEKHVQKTFGTGMACILDLCVGKVGPALSDEVLEQKPFYLRERALEFFEQPLQRWLWFALNYGVHSILSASQNIEGVTDFFLIWAAGRLAAKNVPHGGTPFIELVAER